MNLAVGRIVSALVSAGGWLLLGVRTVLDLIGYSTVPDDANVAVTRLEQFFLWLLTVPWWAIFGFALISSMWLMWVSWPRSIKPTLSEPPTIADDKVHSQPTAPQAISPLESHFSRKVIRAVDLVHGAQYVVEDKVFEDCAIYGPACISILADKPTSIEHCSFGSLESVFIEVDANRPITGVIGFRGCRFLRCQFIGIALVGTAEMIAHMKQNSAGR